jgi:hypothetical protein
MFDKLLREMKKLERGVQVPIQIAVDDDGHLDRRCPSEKCHARFKVLLEDWKHKVRDEEVYCPMCRYEAKATEWNTPEQANYMRKAGLAYVQNVVRGALREDSRRFNATQPRGGFIQLSLSYRPGPTFIVIPPDAAECLRQHCTCESCGCRYSSLGAAFFCPACGHNSAKTTFSKAVQTVRSSVSSLDAIKAALNAGPGEDVATDTARHILENGLVKLVASFQRYAEAAFSALPNASNFKVRKNLFQNISESSALWKSATGKGYDDLLDAADMPHLNMFFQQRHLLAHREGIVDQEYIDKTQDSTYRPGQKLVIKEAAVNRLADIVQLLASAL